MATNPMQRKARISFILGVLITLVLCGVVIALLFMKINDYQKKEKENLAAQVKVFALNTDVKTGQTLTSDMFSKITVNKSMVPADAIGNLDNLEVYALQDKEGNEIHTKRDEDGTVKKNEDGSPKLFITLDNKEYEVTEDQETGNYFIVKNSTKTYLELNSIPIIAKVTMNKNTIITRELITKGDNTVADDVRRQEYNTFVLPMDLQTGDYIDVRLMLPTGQDYIVLAKKEVEVPMVGGADSLDTIWLQVREDEIQTISSAIVDAYRIIGSKLYVTKYTEAGMQKAATPTYVVTGETLELIKKNPNILEKAKTELASRYNSLNYSDIRDNYINRSIQSSGEDGESQLKEKLEESITVTQDTRRKYLDSVSGVE